MLDMIGTNSIKGRRIALVGRYKSFLKVNQNNTDVKKSGTITKDQFNKSFILLYKNVLKTNTHKNIFNLLNSI